MGELFAFPSSLTVWLQAYLLHTVLEREKIVFMGFPMVFSSVMCGHTASIKFSFQKADRFLVP